MKKITLFFIFILIFILIINSTTIINNIMLSFNVCFNNLFPAIIPFMLLSNLLIKYNFVEEISNLFKYITPKVFMVNENCSFAIIMSMLSGTPSNSRFLKDSYDNNLISDHDIKKCLNFCHFINPIFIIGTIGNTFLGNRNLGIIILISHYISSFFVSLLFRKNNTYIPSPKKIVPSQKEKFIFVLTESIISTANTLLIILGVITFCLIITALLDILLNINNNYKYIYGLLEITQGLKYLSLSNLNLNIKSIIASFLISFGGICIHLQVFSILDNKKIRYFPYFVARMLHAIISACTTCLITMLFH